MITLEIPDTLSDELKEIVQKHVKLGMNELIRSQGKDFLSQQEAMEYLGLSYGSFKKLLDRGLPCFKVDRKLIFSRREIQRFISDNSTYGGNK